MFAPAAFSLPGSRSHPHDHYTETPLPRDTRQKFIKCKRVTQGRSRMTVRFLYQGRCEAADEDCVKKGRRGHRADAPRRDRADVTSYRNPASSCSRCQFSSRSSLRRQQRLGRVAFAVELLGEAAFAAGEIDEVDRPRPSSDCCTNLLSSPGCPAARVACGSCRRPAGS